MLRPAQHITGEYGSLRTSQNVHFFSCFAELQRLFCAQKIVAIRYLDRLCCFRLILILYALVCDFARAPELFEVPSNCVITVKTDMWSLGCSVYAAAFGGSPCDGSALSAMSGRITFPREQ